MLRIKARIETPTGHKDLIRVEEVTIVLGDEALAEIAKVVASQQSVQPTIATAALEDSPFETGIRRNAVVLSNRNSG